MSYRIFRHPDAAHDVRDIENLISRYAGPAVALRKLNEIDETLKSLSKTPHKGSKRDYIYPGLRAIPTARKGVITVIVDDEAKAVYVVSITYAGAEWYTAVSQRTTTQT